MAYRLIQLVMFCLILGLSSTAFGWPWSKGSIIGTVVNDANIGQHIDNVQVSIEELDVNTQTNEFGEFRIKKIPFGDYTLTIRKPGFMPLRMTVSVTKTQMTSLDIRLKPEYAIYNVATWVQKATTRLRQLLISNQITHQTIAIAFYKKNDIQECDLPDMVLRFATAFNATIGNDDNKIVIRDLKQATTIMQELRSHKQFKLDFDPSTVAMIGKKLGASMIIIGALLEKRTYIEPLINGTSVEEQAYIPGLSLNDILLQKEISCQ